MAHFFLKKKLKCAKISFRLLKGPWLCPKALKRALQIGKRQKVFSSFELPPRQSGTFINGTCLVDGLTLF